MSETRKKPVDLEEMLERIAAAEDDGGTNTSVEDVVSEVGRRSFGPLLLLPGLITLLPVGGIPGVPTVMGLLVLLVAVQLVFGRESFWLPDFILRRSVERGKLEKSRQWMQRPARFIDRFLRPRLTRFVHGPGIYAIAVLCLVIALMMPPMEFVPFSAVGAGLGLTLFGLALMAEDGLLALIGILSTLTTLGLVFYNLI